MKQNKQILDMIQILKDLYPEAKCSLNYEKDYELLFATRLSAQCTDERVNQITPTLFKRYPTLDCIADAELDEVATIIHSCGFYRVKSKDLVFGAQMLIQEFDGVVPDNMQDLLKLPGIGRKTANLILGDIYHVPGVVVADTHCIRISGLLGLTDGTKDPLKTEQQLRACLPINESNDFCHRLVLHGRAVCKARKPDCENCQLNILCDYFTNEKDLHV